MGIPNVRRSLRDRSKSRVRNHDEEEVVQKDPLPIPGTTKKAVKLTTRKSILKKQKLSEDQEDYLSNSLVQSDQAALNQRDLKESIDNNNEDPIKKKKKTKDLDLDFSYTEVSIQSYGFFEFRISSRKFSKH